MGVDGDEGVEGVKGVKSAKGADTVTTRCRHGDAQDVYDSLLLNTAQQFPGLQLGR